MSKEEILQKHIDSKFGDVSEELKFVSLMHFPIKEVYKAMDEHAASESEEFMKWQNDNGYLYNGASNDFYKYNKNTKSYCCISFTDLYEQFKNRNKTDKP